MHSNDTLDSMNQFRYMTALPIISNIPQPSGDMTKESAEKLRSKKLLSLQVHLRYCEKKPIMIMILDQRE